MCHKKSSASKTIDAMFVSADMDAKVYSAKAKLLLNSYRHVCWASLGSFQLINEDDYCICDEDIDQALEYLTSYTPDVERRCFEQKLKALFKSRWMVELVDDTMLQVREFPDLGELYFELLSKFYLTKFKYGEAELLDLLKLERSTYYDRKGEAIRVFALAMWGTVLPRTMALIETASEEFEEPD